MHKNFKKIFVLFISILVLHSNVISQVKIYINDTSEDLVGERLVYKIRESIRESNGLELALIKDESILRLRILTLDPGNTSSKTIYSLVWTLSLREDKTEIFYTHKVGTCGSSRVNEVAEGIVADTDKIAQDLKELYATILNRYYNSYDKGNEKSNEESDVIIDKLGVEVVDCSNEKANKYDLTHPHGVVVEKIKYNSPAQESELNIGDIILEVEDYKIIDVNSYNQAINKVLKEKDKNILLYVLSERNNYRYIVLNIE